MRRIAGGVPSLWGRRRSAGTRCSGHYPGLRRCAGSLGARRHYGYFSLCDSVSPGGPWAPCLHFKLACRATGPGPDYASPTPLRSGPGGVPPAMCSGCSHCAPQSAPAARGRHAFYSSSAGPGPGMSMPSRAFPVSQVGCQRHSHLGPWPASFSPAGGGTDGPGQRSGLSTALTGLGSSRPGQRPGCSTADRTAGARPRRPARVPPPGRLLAIRTGLPCTPL